MRLLVAATLLALPSTARAAGFQVYEHSATATGQVGAFTAQANDASAVFYNPAGLADLGGLHVSLGTTLVTGRPSASSVLLGGTADSDVQAIPLPAAYVSYGVARGVTVGVGAFTQYGLSVDWGESWGGRFVDQRATLTTLTINPSAAWRPLPWLAIGAGLDITPSKLEVTRALDLVAAEGTARFAGNAVGWGGNAAVLVNLPYVDVGVAYRSQYDLTFDDGALRIDAPLALASSLHDSRASTTLDLPDVLSVGVRGRPVGRLAVQAQLDWVNWSRFREVNFVATDAPLLSTALPQDWNDGWTLRLGGEMPIGPVTARAGFGYDWTPVPADTLSPLIPDADRFLVSAGGSMGLPADLIVDLAFMGVIFRDRTSTLPELPVEYSNWGFLTTLTLRYQR